MAWEAIQTRRIKPHDIGEGTLRRHAAGTVSFPVLCKNRKETLMSVLVIGRNGRALMPTNPRKARLLLKKKTASVVCRHPFTIQLLYKTGCATQEGCIGIDTGSQHIGVGITCGETFPVSDKSSNAAWA